MIEIKFINQGAPFSKIDERSHEEMSKMSEMPSPNYSPEILHRTPIGEIKEKKSGLNSVIVRKRD